MVSLRRRKLLRFCGGSSFPTPHPGPLDNGIAPVSFAQFVSVQPLPSNGVKVKQTFRKSIAKGGLGLLSASASSSSKEQQSQPYPEQPIKRRKQHRRKHVENQEPCLMRGVYFKNMKWQAAIKVDKKQIHLGTVGSQEEAAHLYDRAAFMCGREPNFELSQEEKEELRRFKWDEFLAITRRTINTKKHRKRTGAGLQRRSQPLLQNNADGKHKVNSSSTSEDLEAESSAS